MKEKNKYLEDAYDLLTCKNPDGSNDITGVLTSKNTENLNDIAGEYCSRFLNYEKKDIENLAKKYFIFSNFLLENLSRLIFMKI